MNYELATKLAALKTLISPLVKTFCLCSLLSTLPRPLFVGNGESYKISFRTNLKQQNGNKLCSFCNHHSAFLPIFVFLQIVGGLFIPEKGSSRKTLPVQELWPWPCSLNIRYRGHCVLEILRANYDSSPAAAMYIS